MTILGNTVSSRFPILPVKNTVVFPQMEVPLSVGRPGSLAAVEEASKHEDKTLVVLTQKDPEVSEPKFEDLFQVGTKVVLRKLIRGDRGVEVIALGVERVRLNRIESTQPYLTGEFSIYPMPTDATPESEALLREVQQQVNKLQSFLDPNMSAPLSRILGSIEDSMVFIFLLASMLPLSTEREQQILESQSRTEALKLMHEFLVHELQVLELQKNISTKTQTKISQQQREAVLRHQLETIQKELGEKDPVQAELGLLSDKLAKANVPEEQNQEIQRELNRIKSLPSYAPDYQMLKSYLEFVAELPWSKLTEDNLDLKHARTILDEDHYNLNLIKDRIIEHLAVMKLNPQSKAPILCFVGPPGVGKTSLGESIARSLGRNFERMSVGGLHDEAELRGHRRTYIGAMPGRILQAIRRTGVRNPVLMLDEIDKIGHDFRGDPAAALMEILDPSQNKSFRDNYLNLPFDLSQVFFILTGNTVDTVSRPLLDRMEVLRLAGYTDEEKLEIAKRYIVPRVLQQTGLSENQFSVTDSAINCSIRQYTREAGLRELERTLARMARKTAVQIASQPDQVFRIDDADLAKLLGPQPYFSGSVRRELLKDVSGVAVGLAWTPTGGEVIYIEATLLPEGSGITMTGHLGDIMKESVQTAQSYVWTHAEDLNISKDKFTKNGVHIHIPEGATPKDGPSAGITIATALIALYRQQRVRPDTAMTGEITLTGLILPIGGLKEKALAAQRVGFKRVIFPKGNEKELEDFPDSLLKDTEFKSVETIGEVIQDVFLLENS